MREAIHSIPPEQVRRLQRKQAVGQLPLMAAVAQRLQQPATHARGFLPWKRLHGSPILQWNGEVGPALHGLLAEAQCIWPGTAHSLEQPQSYHSLAMAKLPLPREYAQMPRSLQGRLDPSREIEAIDHLVALGEPNEASTDRECFQIVSASSRHSLELARKPCARSTAKRPGDAGQKRAIVKSKPTKHWMEQAWALHGLPQPPK